MSDALNLARAGLLDYETALGLTEYLKKEDEYLPWTSTFTALSYVNSMMRRTPGYGLFKVSQYCLIKFLIVIIFLYFS